MLARAILSLLFGRKRSLGEDANTILQTVSPAPLVLGAENIPDAGSFLVVANHFERKGLWVAWGALLITAAIQNRRPDLAGSIRWTATSEWPLFRLKNRVISNPLYRWAFRRASHTYGLILLPADSSQKAKMAKAIHRLATFLRPDKTGGQATTIGIFPEGRTGNGLFSPPAGAGSLLALLNRRDIPILPVGLFEEGGQFTARFGEPFELSKTKGIDRRSLDQTASEEMMVRIGTLLPETLWGNYYVQIQQRLTSRPTNQSFKEDY